jgi:hypothetical protein
MKPAPRQMSRVIPMRKGNWLCPEAPFLIIPLTTMASAQIQDQFSEARRQLTATRKARVKAFQLSNPRATAGELMRYEQKLEAQDKVALAPLDSDLRQAQTDEQAMRDGFDPRTGNRMTDILGAPVNAPNGALQAAIRKDTPGSMAVDFGKYNRGEVEQWGHGGLKASAMPMSIKVGLADRMKLNKAIIDPILQGVDTSAKGLVHDQGQRARAMYDELSRQPGVDRDRLLKDLEQEASVRPEASGIPWSAYSFDPPTAQTASPSFTPQPLVRIRPGQRGANTGSAGRNLHAGY